MKKIIIILSLPLLFVIAIHGEENKNVYKSVDTSEKKIALSFDDGPHPTQTQEILAILKKYDIKATFFVVGKNAENYPDILRQTVEYGHEIGNHTYSHKQSVGNSKEINKELEIAHNLILETCEYNTKIFRPPGGKLNQSIKNAAENHGYKIILWNVDTKDWTHKTAHEIAENVLNNTKSGSIILMHDYISKKSSTSEALELFIPILIKKGYSFVTVSELIESDQSV